MPKQVTVEELQTSLESILDQVEDGMLIEVVREGKLVAIIEPVVQVARRSRPSIQGREL